jgi:type II secretory pathway pseudopilin PulG
MNGVLLNWHTISLPSFLQRLLFSKKRRRGFILVEVVIAAILAAILTTAVLGLFYQCFKTSRYYEKAIEREGLQMARAIKLRSILRSIKMKDKDPFYVIKENDSDHLFFSCFPGNRYEIGGSNELYGQLLVNGSHELIFVYSSHSSKTAVHTRGDNAVVLWPNVRKISFSFVPNSRQRMSIPGLESLEKEGSLGIWEKEWNELPAVIIATLYEQGEKEPITVSSIVLNSLQEIQVP